MAKQTRTEQLQAERALILNAREKAQQELDNDVMPRLADSRDDKRLKQQRTDLKVEIARYNDDLEIIEMALRAEAQRTTEAARQQVFAEQANFANKAQALVQQIERLDGDLDAAVVAVSEILHARNKIATEARTAACKALRPAYPTIESWMNHVHSLPLPDALPIEHIANKLVMLNDNAGTPKHLRFAECSALLSERLRGKLADALRATGATE